MVRVLSQKGHFSGICLVGWLLVHLVSAGVTHGAGMQTWKFTTLQWHQLDSPPGATFAWLGEEWYRAMLRWPAGATIPREITGANWQFILLEGSLALSSKRAVTAPALVWLSSESMVQCEAAVDCVFFTWLAPDERGVRGFVDPHERASAETRDNLDVVLERNKAEWRQMPGLELEYAIMQGKPGGFVYLDSFALYRLKPGGEVPAWACKGLYRNGVVLAGSLRVEAEGEVRDHAQRDYFQLPAEIPFRVRCIGGDSCTFFATTPDYLPPPEQ